MIKDVVMKNCCSWTIAACFGIVSWIISSAPVAVAQGESATAAGASSGDTAPPMPTSAGDSVPTLPPPPPPASDDGATAAAGSEKDAAKASEPPTPAESSQGADRNAQKEQPPAKPSTPVRSKRPAKKAFRDSAKTEPVIPVDKSSPTTSSGSTSASAADSSSVGRVEVPVDNSRDRKGASSIPSGQELINIDFPEPTEIKDIIKAVALWTNKNVILDRNVSGKVQIISPRKVTKEEAYQAFLSALNLLGMTTVETGKVIKIMPVRTAVKDNLKTFLGTKWTLLTDEIITQIVPLKYVNAKEIQTTLSRIVSPNSMIAYEKSNTLIISDSGYKVRRILDILELLDVQGQQPQVSIVPIRYADAKSIVDKITELLKAGSGKGGSAYKLLTDERANSVIIFGPPRTISDVKNLVKRFDTPIEDPTKQSTIHVRPLDYADAKKLAATLSSLAQGQSGGNSRSSRRLTPLRPTTANARAAQPAAVAQLDEGTKITADEQSNSLLITGSRAAYNAINSIIRKLDIRRSQVFVEADILDINVDNRFKFGTSIFGGRGGQGNSNIITTWEAGKMAPLVASQAAGSAAASAAALEKVASAFAEDMTIGVLAGKEITVPGLGTFTPGGLIKLIKTDSNTRVLSSPHILTANNEEAKITVGEKIFFKSAEFNAQTGVAIPKVEKEDVDLTLSLKPNISNANFVTMKVELESSTPQLDSQTGLPKINKRKTSQVLTVKNMQTVVVSGLVQSTEYEQFQKIPLLGDIPILGWLFRNSTTGTVRNNLVIFLTPHIIHGADDLAAVYQRKIKERDDFMQQVYGSRFRKDDFYALLPKAEDGEWKADESEAPGAQGSEVDSGSFAGSDSDSDDGQNLDPTGSDDTGNSNAVEGNEAVGGDMLPVPFGGSSDGGGSSSGSDSSLPPPPPPPPLESMDGGFDGGPGGAFDAPPPADAPAPVED